MTRVIHHRHIGISRRIREAPDGSLELQISDISDQVNLIKPHVLEHLGNRRRVVLGIDKPLDVLVAVVADD